MLGYLPDSLRRIGRRLNRPHPDPDAAPDVVQRWEREAPRMHYRAPW